MQQTDITIISVTTGILIFILGLWYFNEKKFNKLSSKWSSK
jgi:hypothetical protein